MSIISGRYGVHFQRRRYVCCGGDGAVINGGLCNMQAALPGEGAERPYDDVHKPCRGYFTALVMRMAMEVRKEVMDIHMEMLRREFSLLFDCPIRTLFGST